MITETELRSIDLFVAAILRAVDKFPADRRACSVKAVCSGQESLFFLLRLGVNDQIGANFQNYGKIQLRSEVFATTQLQDRLWDLQTAGSFTVASESVAFKLQNCFPQQAFQPADSDYHEWPGYLYSYGQSDTYHLPSDPLVFLTFPPYANPKEAVQSWAGVRLSDSDGRLRRFLMFVPHFQGKIDTISFEGSLLTIHCSGSGEGVFLAVLAEDEDGEVFRESRRMKKSQEFKLMERPTRLDILLVDSVGNILDRFTEDEHHATRDRVIYAGAKYSANLMDMVRRGENEHVEFKEFIRLDDQRKRQDIIKSVIAFANTAGGSIIVGVNDEAEIVGVDAFCPNDPQKAATFEKDYFRGVQELLKNNLNRIPKIDYSRENVGGKSVFVFHVHEGFSKPYVNATTKETYIRRGGSIVRPDPASEIPRSNRGILEDL